MSKVHKIVKLFAVALAILIIGSIISGIMVGFTILSNAFDNKESNLDSLKELNILNNNYSVLDIEIESSNILIKNGTDFKIESNNKNISINEISGRLIIKEKNNNWFNNKEVSDLVIYVPVSYILDEVSLDSGAGNVDIDSLITKKLDLDLGAGKVTINNLESSSKTEINGGAGEIIIKDSDITNLDLDMGVGKLVLDSKILGNSEINCGIGQVNITLLGGQTDYKIKANKGIGNFSISGVSVSDGTYYGNGSNFIDVDGGVGEININFN